MQLWTNVNKKEKREQEALPVSRFWNPESICQYILSVLFFVVLFSFITRRFYGACLRTYLWSGCTARCGGHATGGFAVPASTIGSCCCSGFSSTLLLLLLSTTASTISCTYAWVGACSATTTHCAYTAACCRTLTSGRTTC